MLADFRAWLAQPGNAAPPPDGPEFDWQTLTAEFTALRHEVNLQTRAARAQAEQSADALDRLGQALDALEQARDDCTEADEALRPLLKALVDVHDALALAEREVERVQAAVEQLLPLEEVPALDASRLDRPHASPARKRPWWRWWSAGGDAEGTALLRQRLAEAEAELAVLRREQQARAAAAGKIRQFLTSVLSGYKMSLQRIDRVLQQHGLEAIACVGLPFDPEAMEVVEVVREPGRDGTEVLQEVRRGYRWRDRLFRCAQVRVARP